MPEIIFENVTVYYEEKGKRITALDSLSSTFGSGKTTCILGESGGGKTTILKCLTGEILYNGKILIDGKDLAGMKMQDRSLSYMSQENLLYDKMSIFENIAFPLTVVGASREEILRRVNEAASFFGISYLLPYYPDNISLGEKALVTLAKLSLKRSKVYLFDESFAHVDKENASRVKTAYRKWAKEYKLTSLFVTHSFQDATYLGDEALILEEGKKLFQGTPKELLDNSSPSLRGYKDE